MASNILETRSNRFVHEILLILISILIAQPPSASAQCQGLPGPPQNPIVVEGALPSILCPIFGFIFNPSDASIGMDGCGRFMVAWTVIRFPIDEHTFNGDSILIQRMLPDGTFDGLHESITSNLPNPPITADDEGHREPSIAISPTGNVRIAYSSSTFCVATNTQLCVLRLSM